jgi:hypothetical protein
MDLFKEIFCLKRNKNEMVVYNLKDKIEILQI